ncbi:MAG: hypothetical protein ACK443_06400 [Methylococcaceae bacterium]|jgi:hypothetical protein
MMKGLIRLLFAVVLLALHYLIFPVPVVESFMAYILLFNPRWFRSLLEHLK